MIRIAAIVAIIVLMFFGPISADEYLPGLIINYGDFSYILSVAVGFDFVYFGTTSGIIKYNINAQQWETPLTGINGLYGNQIQQIKASQDDRFVWAHTEEGYFEYNQTFNRWTPVDTFPDEPSRGYPQAIDPFFVAPAEFSYLSSGVLVDNAGRRYPLTVIVDDGWGNLWIGTWGAGVFRAESSNRRMERLPYGLFDQNLSIILADSDDELWTGGENSLAGRMGITRFDWIDNRFDGIELSDGFAFKTSRINDISSGNGILALATENGVLLYNQKERKISGEITRRVGLPDNRVLSVLQVGDTLLAGTEFGLSLIMTLPDSTPVGIKTILPSSVILSLCRVDNTVWIGTAEGVFRFNLSDGKISHLTSADYTAPGGVVDMKVSDSILWLATTQELVSINLQTAEVSAYPEIGPYGQVRALAARDTLLAVATGGGMVLFYLGENRRHRLFNTNDGLLSDDIRDLVFDGDYIWLATDRGLTRFWYRHPEL